MAFPLAISPNRRHLVDASGVPFLLNGDTPWMMPNQCNEAQIDTYLSDRQARGFNAILFEAPGAHFTTQTPKYNNIDGVAPFQGSGYAAVTWQSLNDAYWQRVDYLVNQSKARGIVCLITPNYLGYGGGSGGSDDQGWDTQVNAASDASLLAYGRILANRYTQGNVIWIAGGDYDPPNIAKGWNVINGIRSVNATVLVSFHGGRRSSGYSQAASQPGFNLNCTYTDGIEYTYCAAEYARPGPMPFFHIEGRYENDGGLSAAGLRRQFIATMLCGGCGHFFGNAQLWGFGGYGQSRNAAEALQSQLDTTGASDMKRIKAFFDGYPWQLLEPKTDGSLVTSGLGTGASRILPARATDGSFAMIWSPGGGITVNLASLAPPRLRARWYNAANGTYTTVTGSPFANSGTANFSPAGDRVLVLDAG